MFQAHIASSMILNGVCVRWTGWIDLVRLDGMGRLEIDEVLARAELDRMKVVVSRNQKITTAHYN